jgi:hypothetical protein
MARNISRFLILSLALARWLSRQDRPIRAAAPNVVSSPIYITHVTVIDTRSGEEDRDWTVIISGNRIQDIETQPGDRTERNGYNYSPEHCLFACGDRSVCHQDPEEVMALSTGESLPLPEIAHKEVKLSLRKKVPLKSRKQEVELKLRKQESLGVETLSLDSPHCEDCA